MIKIQLIKKLISYLLPFTVLVIVPLIIFNFAGTSLNPITALIVLGVLLIISGMVLLIWAIRLFEGKGKGTLAPWIPTKVLITEGPYRYVRNPMISGVLYCLFGMWLISWNYWMLAWAAIFLVGNILYFKLSEEPGLVRRFGEEYIEYRKVTPMWFPKFK